MELILKASSWGIVIKKDESSIRHLDDNFDEVIDFQEVTSAPRPRLSLRAGGEDPLLKENLEDTKKRDKKSKFFYRVKNHQELFKLGTSFYNDFKSGIRSFAIGSTGYQASQQRSILGLASFFDHKYDVKIAIISDNLYAGVFKEIVNSGDAKKYKLRDGAEINTRSFHDHFEFIDLEDLIHSSHQNCQIDYESRLREFTQNYDIIFWDVPELYKIKENPEVYYPMIMLFDSLSLVVARSLSNTEEVKDVTSFFLAYGINLKGLVFDQNAAPENNKKGEKSSWWRFFKK